MKKRALLINALMGSLLLCSCALTQKPLTFDIGTIKKGQSYPVLSYADDKRAHFVSGDEIYESFTSNTYDAVIFDLNKGLDLIRTRKSNYRLARITSAGNAYIVKRNSYKKDKISSFSEVVTFENGLSHYDLDKRDYLRSGIHNNLYSYCTSLELESLDYYYESVDKAYKAFKEGQGDFAILEEPYVSKLIGTTTSEYSLYMNLTEEFHKLDGTYKKVPSYGLFLSPRLESLDELDEDKYILDNFLESIDKNLRDLETAFGRRNLDFVDQYVNNESVDLLDYFGCTRDELEIVLNGDKNINGYNAFGFCSYPFDLDEFIRKQNGADNKLFVPSIPSYCYSRYFNFYDKE